MKPAMFETYREKLVESERYRIMIANRLRRAGVRQVETPPLKIAPTVEQVRRYADTGDIIIAGRVVVEVKSNSGAYQTPDEWPFAVVFLTKQARAAVAGRVDAYVLVSRITEAAVVVGRSTHASWFVQRTQNEWNGSYDVLCAPRSALRTFDQFTRWLLERDTR